MTDRSLPRSERLHTMGAVRRLFEAGESGFHYPFRYVWLAETGEAGASAGAGDGTSAASAASAVSAAGASVEVMFSVPKRFHKRANKRNLLRRRTKEAYRLHKELLSGAVRVPVDMALIYSSKELLGYAAIERALCRILSRIAEELATRNP